MRKTTYVSQSSCGGTSTQRPLRLFPVFERLDFANWSPPKNGLGDCDCLWKPNTGRGIGAHPGISHFLDRLMDDYPGVSIKSRVDKLTAGDSHPSAVRRWATGGQGNPLETPQKCDSRSAFSARHRPTKPLCPDPTQSNFSSTALIV
jgi:hypothetical protein